MKIKFQIILLILILNSLILGCNRHKQSILPYNATDKPEIYTQHSSMLISKMSDLEVIKKSADYMESYGENLIFEETKIEFMNDDGSSPIFINDKNEEVYYIGDYLIINFYSFAQEPESILMVYIGENGKVLGHRDIIK